jgi:hypothetical protein
MVMGMLLHDGGKWDEDGFYADKTQNQNERP